MRLILDTANLDDIKYFNDYFPICGVTTNPTILSREGGDIVAHLVKIREIIGGDKELHVQVTETEWNKMIEEGHAIVALLGENTFVKIPATPDGLRAARELSGEGVGVTMTAVLSANQALLAASGSNTEILAASFKTAREVLECALAGAGAATVSADVMKKLVQHTTTDTSIVGFANDWKNAFGDHTLLELIKNK